MQAKINSACNCSEIFTHLVHPLGPNPRLGMLYYYVFVVAYVFVNHSVSICQKLANSLGTLNILSSYFLDAANVAVSWLFTSLLSIPLSCQ